MPFSLFKEKEPLTKGGWPVRFQQGIDEALKVWTDEIARLKAMNLPLPTLIEKPRVKYDQVYVEKDSYFNKPAHWEDQVTFIFPKYETPPHLVFRVENVAKLTYARQDGRRVGYTWGFISGDPGQVERAKKLHDAHDLRGLINNFPVLFFVSPTSGFTDPYQLFKKGVYSDYKSSGPAKNKEWKPTFYNLPEPSPFYEVIPYLDKEALDIIEERLQVVRQFYFKAFPCPSLDEALLTNWRGNPSFDYNFDTTFLLNAVLPEKAFAAEAVTLKFLPSPDIKNGIVEQFFDSIRPHLNTPSALEVVSTGTSIYFQLSVAKAAQKHIEQQINVFFPDCGVLEVPDEAAADATYYTLKAAPRRSYSFIKTSSAFSVDPYSQLLEILSALDPHERSIAQVVFAPFPEATFRRLTDFARDKEPRERHRQLTKKQPAWAVLLSFYSTNRAAIEKIKTNFVEQYETPEQRWRFSELKEDQPLRRNLTAFGVVNSAELTALAHFPDKTVDCDLLEIASMKSKLPPDLCTHDGILIGEASARGQVKPVVLPESVRDRHVYVVGKSGTGKSTLLSNCIRQDIESGAGVAVIDPHGDLVDDILQCIPERRIEDTIYFNAADRQFPIGLNILNAQTEDEIGLLADDLLVMFKRFSESWGDRMENLLRFSFHTLLSSKGSTFLDIKALLQKKDFRERTLANIHNSTLDDFWKLEYPRIEKDASPPILSRMSKFSLSPILARILGQPDSILNFSDVIRNKKILLVNISKGQIGEDTAQLLGSLIVSQLQLAVMRRAALPKESRDPYYLYVDEFQDFTTSAFAKILSEARKYQLCLTLAHQYTSQLDEKTKNAILANVGTIVMFQSYPADAAALRPELGQYEPADVTNLSSQDHEALCKPATQSKDTFKFITSPPLARPARSYADLIIENTRKIFSSPPQPLPPSIDPSGPPMVADVQVAVSTPPAIHEEKEPYTEPVYFVDGLHICRWSQPVSLSVLLILLKELVNRGHSFLCVFDANTRHVLDREGAPGDSVLYQELLVSRSHQFAEVPGRMKADDFLLKRADTAAGRIISNDQFREYIGRYAWLETEPHRLIKGSVVGNFLTVPELNLDLRTDESSTQLCRELKAALSPGEAATGPAPTREEPKASPPVGISVSSPKQPRQQAAHEARGASSKVLPPKPPERSLGRGGQEHKLLQAFIKQTGEKHGYITTIEKQIPGSNGSIDVALEKKQRSIACEISISSTAEYELQNIRKGLAAGFDYVFLISTKNRFLNTVENLVASNLGADDLKRVRFFTPGGAVMFVEELSANDADREETVLGYNVKTKHKTVSDAERKDRRDAIDQTILQSLRRLKQP
jgi:hypothetical protein